MTTVGIIGGSGFIGSYNTRKFLEEGYRVKVSTTDLSNPDKYTHLQALNNSDQLEIVQLDVTDKEGLAAFLQGCEIVVHGGTPFQLDVKDPKKELFDPTILGTENFLDVVQSTPGIKKIIFIASVAAFNTHFPLLPDNKQEGDQISEADAPFMSEQSHPYGQAKFLANQVVGQFIATHPNIGFDIVTVSPVGVMGKALSGRQDATSTGLQFLFRNKLAPNPFFQMFYDNDIYFALIDVEDVAEAIYKAAITPNIHGRNYLLSGESYRVSDITLLLNNQAPSGKPVIVYNSDLAKKELGLSFKPASVPLNAYSS